MLNLELAISDWRRELQAAGIKNPVLLDELEAHLRDDMEQQMRCGMEEKTAFENAVARIGGIDLLNGEFTKLGLMQAARERKIDTLSSLACASVGWLTGTGILWFAPLGLSRLEMVVSFLGICLGLVLLCGGRSLHRFLPVISRKPLRTRIQLATGPVTVAWLVVYFNFISPLVDVTGAWFVLSTWAVMIPCGLLGGIAYGLEEAARKQIETADS